jgi:hypothetical protein
MIVRVERVELIAPVVIDRDPGDTTLNLTDMF